MTCKVLLGHGGQVLALDDILLLARLYRGKFALDFAYEDWASAYRDTLHAAYIQAMEQAVVADVKAGHYGRAMALARRALDVDPAAEPLERLLLDAYHRSGSPAAAAEQYSHYASVFRDEIGVEPPSLEQLLMDKDGLM